MKRTFTVFAAVCCLTLGLVAGSAGASYTTGDEWMGSYVNDNYGAANHNLKTGWVNAAQNYPHRDELNLAVQTNNIGGAEGENCIQIAFDYVAIDGHYDVRIVRNCDSNSTRKTPVDYYEPLCGIVPCNLRVRMIQFAVFDPETRELSQQECWRGTNEACLDWDPVGNVNSSRIWGRLADGTNWYQSGGDPESPTT